MNNQQNPGYKTFFGMIVSAMILMYLLMYVNSYKILEHAWFSETRLFMTLLMGAVMALVMLFFMRRMYTSRMMNIAIVIGALVLIASAVWLVRSQITVTGVDYMEAMIPHHSIAILTSERARIKDLRVRQLADEIIAAQRREIKEMEWLIRDIRANGIADTPAKMEAHPVPEFSSNP